MKKILFGALCAGMMTSCSLVGGGSDSADAVPFQSSENGRWGMIKPDGKVLFEEEYKNRPTLSYNERFGVKNSDNLWEIYTATEKPEKVGEEYTQLSDFKYGVALSVKKDERIKIIDRDGGTVATLEKSNGKNITRCFSFYEGLAMFMTDDAAGVIDTKGKIIVEAQKFFSALPVTSDRIIAIEKKYQNKETKERVLTILDGSGKEVSKVKCNKYDEVNAIMGNSELLAVTQNNDGEVRCGLIDMNGEVVAKPSPKIKNIVANRNDNFIFSDGENCGVMKSTGEIVIRAKYDKLTWASDELLWAYKIGNNSVEASLIDLEGNEITKDSYVDATKFLDGNHAFVKVADHEWNIINKKGEEQKDVKSMNDVYDMASESYDDAFHSEYIDIDVIVAYFNMSKEGIGEFLMTNTVEKTIKTYNENVTRQVDEDTNYMDYMDSFGYIHNMEGTVEVKVNVVYNEGVGTRLDNGKYAWKDIKPALINLTVPCSSMKEKQKELFTRLADKAKGLGKVYKENKNACMVKTGDDYGIVVAIEDDNVYAFMCDTNVLENIDISRLDDSDNSSESSTDSSDVEEETSDYGNDME